MQRMVSPLLRRLSTAQLVDALRRQTASPWHVIIWDNRPVRLGEALTRLEHESEDSYFYATPERVFSTAGATRELAPVSFPGRDLLDAGTYRP